ncbi:acyl-coenzyme A synthetase ACSM3, mitochondrial-like isoform X2 [Hemicordylus capensis]|uniref:acyl-coenzyme A synthetase ACSM3, mitochondrial-like isoform X2 n=1 Tax=Hemicordylus capensis TaxID=884348 RepID=UPI0023043F26|nr:acyl-coenzyme A synthetase ACSM3, mitochondrial-like isoform X2 [Hemicordylus capensis]
MKLLSKLPRLKSASINYRLPYGIKSQTCSGFPWPGFADSEALFKDVPEHFNFAVDVLDKWSQRDKDGRRPPNPALWWVGDQGDEVRWTFEELGFFSRKAANVLSQACKLSKGDRVLIMLPRVPEWWLITVGCMRAGIVFIPATILLTAKDILYRLQTSKAKCIITNDAMAPLVDSVGSSGPLLKSRMLVSKGSREGWLDFHNLLKAASDEHQPVKTKSQDPMTIYFTSGTTGNPKMVEHSCSSLGIGLTFGARFWMEINPTDVMWGLSDPGWVKFAFSALYCPWIQGSCIFAHGMLQFDPTAVLKLLAKYPVTTFCGTPTIFRMLLQHNVSRYQFKSLRNCQSGGEPTNLEVLEQWKLQTGLEIHEGYGQTETIIDEHCNRLPPGKEGDIAVRIKPTRPLGLFLGYVDDPEKTAATEHGDFYLTGDRGIMDGDGYIRFVGRADDIILSSGYRIGPYEVEHALTEHPAVAESAVVSSPDPIRGEVVKAFIILSHAYQLHDKAKLITELQDHVKKVTAPYKYPRKIEFVQHLPKTISGKIQRKELRKKEWEKA